MKIDNSQDYVTNLGSPDISVESYGIPHTDYPRRSSTLHQMNNSYKLF